MGSGFETWPKARRLVGRLGDAVVFNVARSRGGAPTVYFAFAFVRPGLSLTDGAQDEKRRVTRGASSVNGEQFVSSFKPVLVTSAPDTQVGCVIDQLVDLLGKNPNIVFDVVRSGGRAPTLYFAFVRPGLSLTDAALECAECIRAAHGGASNERPAGFASGAAPERQANRAAFQRTD